MIVLGLLFASLSPAPSRADSATDDFAMKATSQTRLAYVVTGNADVDSIVKAGLSGLTLFWRSAPHSKPAIPSASIPRATSSPSSR